MTPVFDEMINQKLLKDNIFAFYLSGTLSELTFGYYDKTKFEGEVHWLPVENQYMYGVRFSDILFNGKSTDICGSHNTNKCLITFDSGSSLMSMPNYAIEFLSKQGIPFPEYVKKCESAE